VVICLNPEAVNDASREAIATAAEGAIVIKPERPFSVSWKKGWVLGDATSGPGVRWSSPCPLPSFPWAPRSKENLGKRMSEDNPWLWRLGELLASAILGPGQS
jgi:hypothetical protein